MRFGVEPWSPDYAKPFDREAGEPAAVDESIEVPSGEWKPIPAQDLPAETIRFVDGVQRVEAWVWIDTDNGQRPGICASYGAGVIRCDGKATLESFAIRRALFAAVGAEPIVGRRATYEPQLSSGDTPEQLQSAVGRARADLEQRLAHEAPADALLVLDGPLGEGRHLPGAIGYIKAHHARYLSDPAQAVVGSLGPGERTPLFEMIAGWNRYSWYLRLPYGEGHDWAGIVRCEASKTLSKQEAVTTANRICANLPRFASKPHKDPRAPQNLYPIAGIEREVRHRLGDPAFLYRELRSAAASA